jgi:hypothetical protein
MLPHINRHLELLRMRTKHLDIYFQRSWPALAKRRQEIAAYNYENSHISLVYQNKPQHAGGLRLMMNSPPNEIVPNLFSAATAVQSFFFERIVFNSSHDDLDVNEGQVVIFPSKFLHQTICSEADDARNSLVADIVVMLKAKSECEKFMPAFSLWQKPCMRPIETSPKFFEHPITF